MVARLDRLEGLWRPHPSLQEESVRQRARVGAGLVVVMLPMCLLAMLLPQPAGQPWPPSGRWLQASLAAALLAAYALVRSGRVDRGVALAILAVGAAVGVSRWVAATRGQDDPLLMFLVFPVLLAGLMLPPRPAAAVAAVTLAGAWMMEGALDRRLGSGIGLEDVAYGVLLVGVAVLAVLASALADLQARRLDERAEAAREAGRRLREAQDQRIRLLQQLAHDMGTPLTPVKLQLRLLQDRVVPAGRDGLAVLRRNVDHLQRLVQDVGDLARLEGGALRLDRRPVDLADLVRHAVESLAPAAAERGVALDAEADGPLPAEADSGRVTQVLYNLVGNALKFTPAGGTVTVRAASEGGMARVDVRDTGAGLRPDQMARLFRAFEQVHDRGTIRRPEDRGSGLGLHISKGLVEAHGGTIAVASDGPGQGSTFTFRLPLAG